MVALTCDVLDLAWDAHPRRPGPPLGTKRAAAAPIPRRRQGRPSGPWTPARPARPRHGRGNTNPAQPEAAPRVWPREAGLIVLAGCARSPCGLNEQLYNLVKDGMWW